MASESELQPGPQCQIVQLLYDRPVVPDVNVVGPRLSMRRFGATIVGSPWAGCLPDPERDPGGERIKRSLVAISERVGARDAGKSVVVQHAEPVFTTEGPVTSTLAWIPGRFAYVTDAVRQTWEWPGGMDAAQRTIQRCTHAVTVVELASMLLPVVPRLDALLETVATLVETQPPLAIAWPRLERFDEPSAFLARLRDPSARQLAAVNVRLFNVGNGGPGDMVMDTLGLTLLGMLGDVQIHFRGLEPGRIAGYLYDVAGYILTQGSVANGALIKDGDTLPAPAPDPGRWRCRHEMALMKPSRGVIDVEPSPPNSARGRA